MVLSVSSTLFWWQGYDDDYDHSIGDNVGDDDGYADDDSAVNDVADRGDDDGIRGEKRLVLLGCPYCAESAVPPMSFATPFVLAIKSLNNQKYSSLGPRLCARVHYNRGPKALV